MRKSNLTYNELIHLAPKDRPFQIEIEVSSGITYGKQIFWCFYDGVELDVRCGYHFNNFWKKQYTGKFIFIDEYYYIYENPELLKGGEEVEEIPVMEGTQEALDKIVI